jgi:hypothetical protein
MSGGLSIQTSPTIPYWRRPFVEAGPPQHREDISSVYYYRITIITLVTILGYSLLEQHGGLIVIFEY